MMEPDPPTRMAPASAAASPDNPAVSEDELEWREYVFFREELRHEDNLINQRVSWLISSQAFLLGGFATLINSSGFGSATTLGSLKSAMVTGLPVAGILAVGAGYSTILAAVWHVHGVRQLMATRGIKRMPSLHNWHTLQLRMGLFGPLVTPADFRGVLDHYPDQNLMNPFDRSGVRTACRIGIILPVLVAGASACGQDSAPPTADKPWRPPRLGAYEAELAHGDSSDRRAPEAAPVDPRKVYSLPELIDLAERNHPDTRVAWERARQAAAAVGLSQSAYYPYLVASAAANYEQAFIPFPKLRVDRQKILAEISQGLGLTPPGAVGPGPDVTVAGGSTLTTDAYGAHGVLAMKWLLYDFGAREATVAAARETLMMANVGFNAAHQKIVFEVTRLFYAYNVARQKIAVAQDGEQSAQTVRQAAQAKVSNGLGTRTDLLQAEEAEAQASFDLETARGALSDAQVALVESLGVLPTTPLQIAGIANSPASAYPEQSVDSLIERALSQRPDLVAKLAEVHALRDEVRRARADGYLPKIALEGNAGYADLNVSVNGSNYLGASDPIYKIGVSVEWPVFDGFARENKLRIAESQLRAAESELAGARDAVVREVWQASTDLKTALHKQESATRLRIAAENSAAAALDSYQRGLGNYVDVVGTQRNVTGARSVDVDTRAMIYTRAAALALSIGDLDRPGPPARRVSPPPRPVNK